MPVKEVEFGALKSILLRLPAILSLASVLVGTCLILWSYSQLSQTYDEPQHIAAGMEWLTKGTYTFDPFNTPLARVSTAIGPFLLGIRSFGNVDATDEGNSILAAEGNSHLHKVLTAARLGILPYFLIACFLTWRITRRWLGDWPAAIATFLFATCPPVLAHAGLATTDVAFIATFLFAIESIWTAVLDPRPLKCALAGLAFGLACITKLSALPYLALSGVAFLAYVLWKKRTFPSVAAWLILFVTVSVTIWAGYLFSIGSIASVGVVVTRRPQSQHALDQALQKLGPARGSLPRLPIICLHISSSRDFTLFQV